MKRPIILLLAVILLCCTGCEVPSKDLSIYFYKDGKLATVKRSIPTIETPLMVAITQLMAGPSDKEQSEGYSTELPRDARARKIEQQDNVAIIDFNAALADYEGVDPQKMLAQIVYTATNTRGVKYVLFKLQGDDNFTLGKDAYVVDHPLERGDLKF